MHYILISLFINLLFITYLLITAFYPTRLKFSEVGTIVLFHSYYYDYTLQQPFKETVFRYLDVLVISEDDRRFVTDSLLCLEDTRVVPKVMTNFFLHANWEQLTKESPVVDGTSCCVILECLVTSIACIT